MQKQVTNDLGRDPIGKLILRLAVPAVLAQIINALYNIVDRIYIGHIPVIGQEALTGVGVTFPILMVITAFSALIGFGGAPRVSIKMGQGDNDAAENIVGNCVVSLISISIILTIIFLTFGESILMATGASEATIGYALDYLNIYVLGTIFVQLSIGLNSFISTQGFAQIAMKTVLIGAILNIILDPIFIFVLEMGVKGAALATILSQAVSAIWVCKFLTSSKSKIKIKKKYFKIDSKVIGPVLALGISPFIMQSTESLVNLSLNSSLQRFGGDTAVGAMTIISSITQFTLMPLSGIASSAQPIIGFNFGARNFTRVRQTFKYLIVIALTFSITAWGLVMLIPHVFVGFFTNKTELIATTVWAIRIFMASMFMLGAQFACQQTFVALGQAKVSLILALLRKVILLVPLIFILPMFMQDKVLAVFLAEPIADMLASITTITVFSIQFKKILNKAEMEI